MDFPLKTFKALLCGFLVRYCYVPPGCDQVMAEQIAQTWEALQLDKHKDWAILGDFNMLPPENSVGHFLRAKASIFWGNESQQTSWNCNRRIDWGFCLCTSYIGLNSDSHFSDHQGHFYEVGSATKTTKKGRLKPGPKWTKPSWLSTDQWIDVLQESWTRHVLQKQSFQSSHSHFHRPFVKNMQAEVQNEWDLFQECLRIVLRMLIKTFLVPILKKIDKGS